MKKILRFTTLLSIIAIGVYFIYKSIKDKKEAREYQEYKDSLTSTASENVTFFPDAIDFDYLNEKRTLAIYLPKNYKSDSIDYPVIYFLDGQSLFDQKLKGGSERMVDELLDSLGQLGIQQSIIVGVYSSDRRMKEYKPFPSDRWYSHKFVSGDDHAKWVVKTVKPWIDDRYRTKKEPEATIIGGASLAGLMYYYMLMEYPGTFGRAIVFSPSFWVNKKVYQLHEGNPNLAKQKIYFGAGELETPTVNSVHKMHDILIEAGMPAENMIVDIEEGEGHYMQHGLKGLRKFIPG